MSRFPSGWERWQGVQAQKGDIIIYACNNGEAGHIAVYESDYVTYHQNYNGEFVERIDNVYYKDSRKRCCYYWGVIRPDFNKARVAIDTVTEGKTYCKVYNENMTVQGWATSDTNEFVQAYIDDKLALAAHLFTRYERDDIKQTNAGYTGNINIKDLPEGYHKLKVISFEENTNAMLASNEVGFYVINSQNIGNDFIGTIIFDTIGNEKCYVTDNNRNVELKRTSATPTNSEKWQFMYMGQGLYKIKNIDSGKFLHVTNGDDKNNVNVCTYDFHENDDSFLWYLMKYNGGYRFVSKKTSNRAMESFYNSNSDGQNLTIYEYTGTTNDAQTFIVEQVYTLGDVNKDGKITLADYTKILAHVKKTQLLTGEALKAADVNKDGKVTLADYTKVLAHVKKTALLF